MKYSVSILVDDGKNIIKLFEPEVKEFENKRASYEIVLKWDKAEFKVTATDASALRAVLNSITKSLIVYEKAIKVKNDFWN